MGDAVRILIWADDPLVRTGLAALLADAPGTVTLQAGPEADLAATVSASDIDVILCDAGRGPDAVLDQLASAGLALIPVVALLPDRAAAARTLAAGTRGLLAAHGRRRHARGGRAGRGQRPGRVRRRRGG